MEKLDRIADSRAGSSLILLALAGTGCALFLWNPAQHDFFPKCLFHELTGLFCPGCGSQRAAHHLLNGRFLLAMQFNGLMVLSCPFIAWWFAARTARIWTGVRLPCIRLTATAGRGILVLVIAFWIARNIPQFPALAPPGSRSALSASPV